jgi:hypothetical protein
LIHRLADLDDATLLEQLGRLHCFRQLADVVPCLGPIGCLFKQRQHLLIYQLFGLCQLRHGVNNATTRAPAVKAFNIEFDLP